MAAIEDQALGTVSGVRVGDQLMNLLSEQHLERRLAHALALGIDKALHPELVADPELVASAALGAVTIGSDRALAALAALCSSAPQELDLWLADLGLLRAEERDAVSRAAREAPRLAAELRRELRPSELYDLLRGEPPEALALALAMRAPPEPMLRYLSDLRGVRPGDHRRGPDGRRRARVAGAGRALDATLRCGESSTASCRGATRSWRRRSRRRAGERGRAARGARASSRPAGRRERGAVRVAQPGHPHRRRAGPRAENRRRLATAAGLEPAQVAMGWQVHGTELHEWERAPEHGGFAEPETAELPKVDGHLTRAARPGLLGAGGRLPAGRPRLGRRPHRHAALRLARAGRRHPRTRARALRRARPPPRSGPGSAPAATRWGGGARAVLRPRRRGRRPHARPARGGSEAKLRAAGVERVEHVDHCTSCRADLYFSHRRDKGVTGRQAGLVVRA